MCSESDEQTDEQEQFLSLIQTACGLRIKGVQPTEVTVILSYRPCKCQYPLPLKSEEGTADIHKALFMGRPVRECKCFSLQLPHLNYTEGFRGVASSAKFKIGQ